jgi:hypothetical protein
MPSSPEQPAPDAAGGTPRAVLLVWLFLAALTGLPYLRAALEPPPGTAFVGFFYYVDDAYNYLSFTQQSEDGAFRFRNKLVARDHEPALVNLEWWLVGKMSLVLGRRPALAYRLFGAAATLALLAGLAVWLRGAGLPTTHLIPALLLVGTGGGLGGLLWRGAGWPLASCLDLSTGLFPFAEMLGNPHFVIGTALLLWALWLHARAHTAAGHLESVALASVLGLVRPYDLVLFAGIRTLSVLWSEPWRRWLPKLVPLAGLAPVALYNFWVFRRNPAFAFYFTAPYGFPSFEQFAWALGPAALLALTASLGAPPDPVARARRREFLVWAFCGALVIVIRPVHFSLQFLVGLGTAFLALAALGLARFRPAVTLIAVVLMSTTAFCAMRLVTSANPRWFAPAARIQAALALRESCRPGDLLLSPPDIGLYAGGLTACKAFVSHPIAPNFVAREAAMRRFYQHTSDPGARAAFLDRYCITHVVLPGSLGAVPAEALGKGTPFRVVAYVGSGPTAMALYAREGGLAVCREDDDPKAGS